MKLWLIPIFAMIVACGDDKNDKPVVACDCTECGDNCQCDDCDCDCCSHSGDSGHTDGDGDSGGGCSGGSCPPPTDEG